MSSKVKKEVQEELVTEPVSLTNRDAATLAKSFAAIAENAALIASVCNSLAGSTAQVELPAPITAAAANATEAFEIIATAQEASPKKRKRERDPDAPKRPGSSFLMFAGDRRDQLKKTHPELTNAEVMRELGNQWRDAPASIREPYEQKYATEIDSFKRKTEEYNAHKTPSSPPPVKASKASKGASASASASKATANISASESSDSEGESDRAETKGGRSKKVSKTTKPVKTKEAPKKASVADKKSTASGKKAVLRKPEASGSTKGDKKTKKKAGRPTKKEAGKA